MDRRPVFFGLLTSSCHPMNGVQQRLDSAVRRRRVNRALDLNLRLFPRLVRGERRQHMHPQVLLECRHAGRQGQGARREEGRKAAGDG